MEIRKNNSSSYIAYGFGLVLVLLIAIIVVWEYSDFVREKRVQLIENHQFEVNAINMLVHNAHLRAITLYKMTTLEDPFELDDAYLEFQKYGENLMKQRDLLVTMNIADTEKAIWDEVKKLLNEGYESQYEVISLINEGEFRDASKAVAEKVTPIQDKLQKKLSEFSNITQLQLDNAKAEAKKLDFTLNICIYILSLACVILAILTIIFTRKNTRTESDLASQVYKIRALYEVASQSHESLDDQIDATLKVGCQLFNVEIGKLCKINANQELNKMINVVLTNNFKTILQKNMEVPLERTFCTIPYNEERIVLLHNIATSDYKTYPCYEFANLGTYIAAPVYVFGKKFGTINFSSFKAKIRPYTEADHDLLYLIGKFVSVIIETQLSQEMIIDKKAADEANEAKSRFLSNMSHELRTPLNAIIGYSELVLGDDDISNSAVIKDIRNINKAGYHLLNLVNNILDISKVESGKMVVERLRFKIGPLLDSVMDIALPLVTENNNKLRIQNNVDNGDMYTDRQKLKQILLNLLSNAGKFTANGQIAIICEKVFRSGHSWLSVTIKDSGSGMDDEAQRIVFDEYTQDKTNNIARHNGTGLGLSICKTFTVMLGGEISVTSKKEEGSEFRIIIPMQLALENDASVSNIN